MHSGTEAFWKVPEISLPVEQADYRLDLPKLGWIVEGHRDTGEIDVLDRTPLDPYTWSIRIEEMLRRRPLRPSNLEAKYELRRYSSALPFPLQP
jgi:hypothetical protein